MNTIFDRLIVKSPKVAEELLNNRVNAESSSTKKLAFTMDASIFRQNESSFLPESLPMVRMLDEGQRELIKQPLTEAFIHLKVNKFCLDLKK